MYHPRAAAKALLALAALTGSPPALHAQQDATSGTVTGVVYDSIARAPLAGALVLLVRADSQSRAQRPRSAVSGAEGRYRIDSVAPGMYLAGFQHARLDSLGLVATPRSIELRASGTRADLAIPSPATISAAICPARTRDDTTALLLGFVRDARTRAGIARARVVVGWSEVVVGATGMTRSSPTVDARAGESGWFAVCGVPAQAELSVRAMADADTSGVVVAQLPPFGVAQQDLYVGPSEPGMATSVEDSIPRAIRRGDARLAGVVRVAGPGGRPIAGARVMLWDGASIVRTNDSGAFFLGGLPSGSRTLEVRAIGYLPARQQVDLITAEGWTNSATVTLTSTRSYLDTVRVSARRVYKDDTDGFERRRKMGLGKFLTREQIESKNAAYASDLVRMMPGVTVMPERFGHQVLVSGTIGGKCRPDIVIDDVRFDATSSTLDDLLSPAEIESMEVYTRDLSAPAQFRSLSGCGVIVVWTRHGK